VLVVKDKLEKRKRVKKSSMSYERCIINNSYFKKKKDAPLA